jgi:phage nucleotide-binding protein
MITLDSLKSPEKRPAIMTIVSDGGMGKTSLAAEFPRPVFIRTEDGTKSIEHREDIALFPLAESAQDVFDAFGALLREDHSFGTVVLDTITQLNTMIEAEVVKADGKAKSINQAAGGYGAGYSQVAEVHRQIREVAGILSQRKNMHVLFLAHAETETVDPPDGDAYTRYSIRMHKKSVSHYSDNVDLVGFIKPQIYTVGSGDKKKATTDGTRVITCYPVPSHISKNRFGIDKDLPYELGSNPFDGIIKE